MFKTFRAPQSNRSVTVINSPTINSNMSITAILTLFKRPHTLIEQLRAVKTQSIPPEHVVIWQNAAPGVIMPDIPDDLKDNVTVINSSKNFGVWARFTVGLLFNSKYICVFDDDTIPQVNWFKNCVYTMAVKRGLLGTIGLRFKEGVRYDYNLRVGWEGMNETVEQVDIVGHAWFFEQEWLRHLWSFTPDYSLFFCAGEDIAFSYCLQKVGINTYVPPHPNNRRNLWGSDPDKALAYGTESVAISQTNGIGNFEIILRDFIINKGFRTINNDLAVQNGRTPF